MRKIGEKYYSTLPCDFADQMKKLDSSQIHDGAKQIIGGMISEMNDQTIQKTIRQWHF